MAYLINTSSTISPIDLVKFKSIIFRNRKISCSENNYRFSTNYARIDYLATCKLQSDTYKSISFIEISMPDLDPPRARR
jgi:hypothetical protein